MELAAVPVPAEQNAEEEYAPTGATGMPSAEDGAAPGDGVPTAAAMPPTTTMVAITATITDVLFRTGSTGALRP